MGWLEGHLSLPFKHGHGFQLYESAVKHEINDGGFHHECTVRKLTAEELAALPALFAKDTYWQFNRAKNGRTLTIGSFEEAKKRKMILERLKAKKAEADAHDRAH